jgi:O-antigen ligase
MLMVLFWNIKQLELKTINILSLFYFFYCILSLAWGSDLREVSRVLLPFIPFFIAQMLIKSEQQLRIVLTLMILGYIVPIIGSAVMIFLQVSAFEVDYHTGITRYYGLATGPHALAHMMLFFSFILALYNIVKKNSRPVVSIGLVVLFIGSLYCIAMTNTRTVYLGMFIFGSLILWFCKKIYFTFVLLIFLVAVILFSGQAQKVFMRAQTGAANTQGMNYVSSGRFSLWDHNIRIFENLTLTQKLIGVGFGNEQKPVINSNTQDHVVSSHNDYLSLLMVSGIIGLILYGLIQLTFLINVLNSGITSKLKYYFISFLLAVVAMNFASNSYVNRFPLAQLFWFIVGVFYALSKIEKPGNGTIDFE